MSKYFNLKSVLFWRYGWVELISTLIWQEKSTPRHERSINSRKDETVFRALFYVLFVDFLWFQWPLSIVFLINCKIFIHKNDPSKDCTREGKCIFKKSCFWRFRAKNTCFLCSCYLWIHFWIFWKTCFTSSDIAVRIFCQFSVFDDLPVTLAQKACSFLKKNMITQINAPEIR